MAFRPTEPSTGSFPRVLRPDLLWTGGCLDIPYEGQVVHSHFGVYLVRGSRKSILIDTGHPAHWKELARHVEEFLNGEPLDYIFPTHSELPHAGLISEWMTKYPDCIAIGQMNDYPLYYPQLADRMRNVQAGDAISLGDRTFTFLPPVWKDLTHTLWGFDDRSRTLFISDAFAYLHYHLDGQCDMLTSEQPLPDLGMIRFFNERALFWTRYTDAEQGARDIDEMLRRISPELIAPAHGGVVDISGEILPLMKHGMNVRP